MPRSLTATVLLIIAGVAPARAEGAAIPGGTSPFLIAPFLLLLTAIALMPFVNRRWWERKYPLVCLGLGAIPVCYYLLILHDPSRVLETGRDYLGFITLIGSLFVVAGGIHIRTRGESTPTSNAMLLAIGAVASNVLGTTGASMILIRPFLAANQHRMKGFHVVFFIFVVSNIGGALSPIGDPPLFLGYLKGVPFFWVLENVWYIWIIAIAAILIVFLALDRRSFMSYKSREGAIGPAPDTHIKGEISGLHNLFFVGVILSSLLIERPLYLREVLMVLSAAASYLTTGKEIHRKNEFNLLPVREVAIIFLGIFATMVPALEWLELNASHIGIKTPGQFYWGTGALSSVLDNAPTYLNFLSASIGLLVDPKLVSQVQHLVSTQGADLASVGGAHAEEIQNTFVALVKYHSGLLATGSAPPETIKICYLIANHGIYLKAISSAAVFFGAVTYIGNGPNFMVKSIAERSGAKTPSFAGYVLRYSIPILVPLFVTLWLLFFRG
ncbi:MAG: sodium:proton antiporter [Ignavibacteria bacterium]|nr:MAG: sodium:proton antiporter [Ignavibacteria bacterium]